VGTLHRIAGGVTQPLLSRARDIGQLQKLQLVERTEEGLRLTDIGRERYARLAAAGESPSSADHWQ
jgi:hypothetical protein